MLKSFKMMENISRKKVSKISLHRLPTLCPVPVLKHNASHSVPDERTTKNTSASEHTAHAFRSFPAFRLTELLFSRVYAEM